MSLRPSSPDRLPMAVEADALTLLRLEHDAQREQLASEAEVRRLRDDNAILAQQLRDERVHHDTQMIRIREDHALELKTIREETDDLLLEAADRIEEAEAQTVPTHPGPDVVSYDIPRLEEDLRKAQVKIASLQEALVSTRRDLKIKSNELFDAAKAVRVSKELGELYRSKAARLEERARQGSQRRYRDVPIQCNETDAILDTQSMIPPIATLESDRGASTLNSQDVRSAENSEGQRATGSVHISEGLRRSTRRLAQTPVKSDSDSKQTSAKRRAREDPGTPAPKRARTSKTNDVDHSETHVLRESIPSSLTERIAGLGTIPLTIPASYLPSEHSPVGWVKRKMIGENYAVARQAFTGYLKHLPGTKEPRRAIFANTQQNPGLPTFPGQPGTMIVSRGDILKITEPTSLFISAVGQPWWLYVGDFMLNIDQPLAIAEWKSLPEKTRSSWATALCDYGQSWEDYLKIMVRIARRRNGETVEDGDVMSDVRLLKSLKESKPPSRLLLQKHDVLQALDRGDETIDVVVLQPHSVDEDLYCELWDIQTGKVTRNPRRP
ncbi:unnamed protein product [Peniophora sp. CBMAI 1063]|nr:unnamed protein product [Peniophora sp. CBMAI 1063]